MPRSITTPQTGDIVWYFSAATGVPPKAALVTETIDDTHFDLYVWDSVPASPTAAFITAVLYSLQGQAAGQSVSAAAVQAGGAGYAVNDLINLANGVVLKVLTVTTGAVATVAVVNSGNIPAGQSPPANPRPQVSTSGGGSGATFNLTWSGAYCTYRRVAEFNAGTMPPS